MSCLLTEPLPVLSAGSRAKWRPIWSPALFTTADEMAGFVYGEHSGANLSKYCVRFNRAEGKTLIVLKPCDTLSFNQLVQGAPR